jgi:hypothetical protein
MHYYSPILSYVNIISLLLAWKHKYISFIKSLFYLYHNPPTVKCFVCRSALCSMSRVRGDRLCTSHFSFAGYIFRLVTIHRLTGTRHVFIDDKRRRQLMFHSLRYVWAVQLSCKIGFNEREWVEIRIYLFILNLLTMITIIMTMRIQNRMMRWSVNWKGLDLNPGPPE